MGFLGADNGGRERNEGEEGEEGKGKSRKKMPRLGARRMTSKAAHDGGRLQRNKKLEMPGIYFIRPTDVSLDDVVMITCFSISPFVKRLAASRLAPLYYKAHSRRFSQLLVPSAHHVQLALTKPVFL